MAVYPVVVNESPLNGPESMVQLATPTPLVVVWHRGLPSAVNDTDAPESGAPALVVRVALNRYCCPVPDTEGADAVKVVGACPTETTLSTVLDSKSALPE
jgi:hypothetical protein